MRWLVLGPLEVWHDGHRLALGGAKQRLVLAHLLLRRNRLVSADRLIEEVWGEDAAEAARSSLHSYVSHLRKLLADGRILSEAGGYRLVTEGDEVDEERFAELVAGGRRALASDPRRAIELFDEALALWRGDPLADLDLEHSLSSEIGRLDELRREAMADRFEAGLTLGHHAELIAPLDAAVRSDPLNERLWGQLMLALYRAGRQADALAAFHRLRVSLADELGIEPSADVARLHQQILQHDPALDVRGEPLRGYQLVRQLARDEFSVKHLAYQPYVGREVEITAILPPRANDAALVRSFETRAQAIARLEHPRVLPLYDYWREPGAAYLVMRHVGGSTLRDAAGDGGLVPRRASDVVQQVAAGLAAAHRQGIAHGAVAAANVQLDLDGNAYLGGFRIDLEHAAAGSSRMPGDADLLADDARGLARLAYEALTGISLDDTPASGWDTHVPPPVKSVIDRALRYDESAHRDPLAFADEFEQALVGRASQAMAVQTHAEPAAAAIKPAAANPYKGLRPFGESDASDFFGREALVERLVERLSGYGQRSARFLAMVGPSGSGKSSVIQAGLVPALRRGAFAGSERWFVLRMVPGNDPFEELGAALRAIASSPPEGAQVELIAGRMSLHAAITSVLPEPGEHVLLVIDQFEELFTQVSDESIRRRFVRALHDAATSPGAAVSVVVTLRADFYDRPLAYRQLARLLADQTIVVTPLAAEELERAIRMPAEQAGVRVEAELTARLIADVTDQPGALPLLQYALTELYDRRRGQAMTPDDYRAIGGVRAALSRRAADIYQGLRPAGRVAARQLLLRLLTLNESGEDTRRRARLSELRALEVNQVELDTLITTLGEYRLLSFDRDPDTREPTVEVAHEALLSAWPRLDGWVEAARAALRAQRRLAEGASEWEMGGRDPGFLLSGRRLSETEGLLRSLSVALTTNERAFLAASITQRDAERHESALREARERRLERRSVNLLVSLVGVLTVAFVVSSTLGFIALQQRDMGDAARLASLAVQEASPYRSLLISLAAYRLAETPATAGALLAAVQRLPAVAHLARLDVGPSFEQLVPSPDGAVLATLADGTVSLLDIATGTVRAQFARDVSDMSFSPDGRYLALRQAGPPGVMLVDVEHGYDLSGLDAPAGTGIAYLSDGARLLLSAANELVMLSTRAETEARQLPLPFAGPYSVAPSPVAPLVLVSSLTDQRSALIESEGGSVVAEFPHGGQAAVSHDGQTAALASGRTITILDLARGSVVRLLESSSGTVHSLRFGPDGRTLVAAGNQIEVWNVRTGFLQDAPPHTFGSSLSAAAVSDDGRTAYAVTSDHLFIVWDLDGSRRFGRSLSHQPADATHQPTEVGSFSPDGRLLALGDGHGGVQLWDTAGLRPAGDPFGHLHGPILAAEFSPDGRSLLTMGPGGAYLWETASQQVSGGPLGDVGSIGALSPDGHQFALATASGEIEVWDVASGAIGVVVAPAPPHREIRSIDYSPDGSRLAVVDGYVSLWDLAPTPEGVASEGPSTAVADFTAARYTPAGRLLIAGDRSGRLIWLDPMTLEALRTMPNAHAGAIRDLAFSPDGRLLASGGDDGQLVVWDVDTGVRYGTLFPTSSTGHALPLYSPTGDVLAGLFANGEVVIWPAAPSAWYEHACQLVGGTPPAAEWDQIVPELPFAQVCPR